MWLLIIMALPVFSTDQLSPAGIDSSRTCARLCKRDFVLHKYLLFMSDIREQLAYERHLSTYSIVIGSTTLSGYDLFHPMQPGRPTYRRIAHGKCYKICENEPFLLGSFCAMDAFIWR